MIAIIDYGMGNLRSVLNAFRAIGAQAEVTSEPSALRDAVAVVLPGVGAFGEGMRRLRETGFLEALETEVTHKRKPFLGLCLGLQLLATTSEEHGKHAGLNWIPGVVVKLPLDDQAEHVRVPHIGWDTVRVTKRDAMYAGLGETPTFYFVHSYVFRPDDPTVVSGVCSYGGEWAASVQADHLWATQFHPEKSHSAGLSVVRNFYARVQEAAVA